MSANPIIDAIGALNWIIPAGNLLLCLILVWLSYKKYPLFSIGTILWFVLACTISAKGWLEPADPYTWEGTAMFPWAISSSLPFVVVAAILVPLYTGNTKMKDFIYNIPAWLFVGVEIIRLTGAVFFIFYQKGFTPAFFSIQAGCLDSFISITSLFVAYRLYRTGVAANRTLLYLWNGIGLYDLGAAASYAVLDYLGMFSSVTPGTSAIGYHPILILISCQVPFWIVTHIVFLKDMEKFVQAEAGEYSALE